MTIYQRGKTAALKDFFEKKLVLTNLMFVNS